MYSDSDSTANLCSTLTHHAALVPVASRDRSPLAVGGLDAGVAVDHHQQAHRTGGRPSAHLVEGATVVVEVETGIHRSLHGRAPQLAPGRRQRRSSVPSLQVESSQTRPPGLPPSS